MKQIWKDALILFAITVIAGVLLAVVNEITKAPIQEQADRQKAEACQKVFEDAAGFKAVETDRNAAGYINWVNSNPQNEMDEVYEATDENGGLLGYVLTVSNKEGYGGSITLAMGIRLDGTLNGVSVLDSSETVGLGLEAENVLSPQFSGKKEASFVYTKNGATAENEIDAISSATITTNAYVNGVNAGLAYFAQELAKGGASNG